MPRFLAVILCLLLSVFCTNGLRSVSLGEGTAKLTQAVESRWKGCPVFPTARLRLYYFEVTLLDSKGESVHAAVKLVRDPIQPLLQVFVNHVWVIQPSYINPEAMVWQPRKLSTAASGRNETIQISLSKDIALVSYGPTPAELTFSLKDGTSLTLANGTYLSEALYGEEFQRRTQLARGRMNMGDVIPNGTAISTMTNSTNQSFLKSQMEKSARLTSEFVDKATFNASDVSSYEKDFHLDLKRKGLWSWALLLIPFYGLVLGPVFGGEATHHYHKLKREMDIVPAAKIFEKLRCHSMFKRCWGNKLAPKYEPCPR